MNASSGSGEWPTRTVGADIKRLLVRSAQQSPARERKSQSKDRSSLRNTSVQNVRTFRCLRTDRRMMKRLKPLPKPRILEPQRRRLRPELTVRDHQQQFSMTTLVRLALADQID